MRERAGGNWEREEEEEEGEGEGEGEGERLFSSMTPFTEPMSSDCSFFGKYTAFFPKCDGYEEREGGREREEVEGEEGEEEEEGIGEEEGEEEEEEIEF